MRLTLTLILTVVIVLAGGCISTGFEFTSDTVVSPKTTVTEYAADGKVSKITVIEAKTSSTRKRGHYDDTTGAGKAAGGMLASFGGIDGILSAIGPWGGVGVVGGLATLLGVAHRSRVQSATNRARHEGEDKGWNDAAQTYSAPPPPQRTPI